MIIDIHAHYVSPELVKEVRRNGARYGVSVEKGAADRDHIRFSGSGVLLRPFFLELCDLPARLPYLDSLNVDVQVVSAWTDMSGDDLPAAEGERWARLQNETISADVKSAGGRFAGMATLPMQNVDAAIRELEYAVGQLGIRSVEMGTNINGRDLDHPEFRPLWKRFADLDVLVLLHPPYKPVGLDRVGDYFLNNLIAYPVDTTIAAARLIFSGIIADLPALKVCLAHGGGFLPYQIGRMNRGFAAHPMCKKTITRPPSDFLSSFYFDTLTHDTAALAYLERTVGADRLLYGSDYPFEMLDESGTSRVRELESLRGQDLDAVLGMTAAGLLGLLTIQREAVSATH